MAAQRRINTQKATSAISELWWDEEPVRKNQRWDLLWLSTHEHTHVHKLNIMFLTPIITDVIKLNENTKCYHTTLNGFIKSIKRRTKSWGWKISFLFSPPDGAVWRQRSRLRTVPYYRGVIKGAVLSISQKKIKNKIKITTALWVNYYCFKTFHCLFDDGLMGSPLVSISSVVLGVITFSGCSGVSVTAVWSERKLKKKKLSPLN